MENKNYNDKKCIKLKTDDYKDIIIKTLDLLYKKEKNCMKFMFMKDV